jgi:hypothetical protein
MQLNKSGILRIRGLPFRVTPMELAIFFSGVCILQIIILPFRHERRLETHQDYLR